MTIKMSWAKEGDRLICRWSESEKSVPCASSAMRLLLEPPDALSFAQALTMGIEERVIALPRWAW